MAVFNDFPACTIGRHPADGSGRHIRSLSAALETAKLPYQAYRRHPAATFGPVSWTLGHVTRARVSQIMSLLCLAPDIQEALLFLPLTPRGRDPIILADLMPIAAAFDWRKQRRL
jgi:hypothetical protein